MIKKRISLILLICVLVLSCAGWGRKDGQKNVELRFSWWGNDQRTAATLKVIDLYMKKNPNVKIEAEYRGKSDQAKIATQLAGGTIADVVQLNPPWMPDMTSNGDFFVNYKSKKSLIDLSGFDSKFLKSHGVYNGKLVGLPTGINARATLINKTVAEEFAIPTGLNTKWTWDDLYNAGKSVNSQNANKYFLNCDSRTLGTFVLRPYIKQKTGRQIIKDDYKVGFSKQNLADALGYISKLYRDKVIQPVQEADVFMDVTSTNPKWINGDIVCEFMWTSQFDGASKNTKGNMGAFIMPLDPKAKDSGMIVQPSQLLAVSKRSKNIDEAVKFVNFFINDLEAGKILKDCRSIPAVKKVREACNDAGLLNKIVVSGVNYGLEHAGMNDNGLSSNAEIEKIFTYAIEKVGFGISPVKVADETMKLLNDKLRILKTSRCK
jgi:oligogalacturonide transport system substrate-binding protein